MELISGPFERSGCLYNWDFWSYPLSIWYSWSHRNDYHGDFNCCIENLKASSRNVLSAISCILKSGERMLTGRMRGWIIKRLPGLVRAKSVHLLNGALCRPNCSCGSYNNVWLFHIPNSTIHPCVTKLEARCFRRGRTSLSCSIHQNRKHFHNIGLTTVNVLPTPHKI